MSTHTTRSAASLAGLLLAFVLVASSQTALAQAPPAPPPTPDAAEAEDDAPPEPERPDDQHEDDDTEATSAGERTPTGEPPAPPSPDALEYGEDPVDPPDAPQPADNAPSSPSETYDEQFLRVARTQGDPIADQFKHGTAMIAVRGTFGSIVDPPEFYEKVGRPDLAAKFERRSTARMIFMGSSVIVGSVGPYVLAVAGSSIEPFCFTTCSPEQQRRQRTANTLYVLAGASFLTGLAGFVSTLFWSAHPVDVDERRALADKHNAKLKDELGLPSEYSAERRPAVRLRFGGAPTDGGALGVVTVSF